MAYFIFSCYNSTMTVEKSKENDILGPYITDPEDARNVLTNYHNGNTDLTPEQYVALYQLLCKDRSRRKTNPKKIARQHGKNRRKKRTGSRRG